MAHPKRTRPSAARPKNCPIDNLPSELLHMVCTHLKPTEVANLRLASKVVAPIGLQYLVPEVHLVIAEDSFQQLAAIARHPVVSKYVTSLYYEADILEVLNEEEWEHDVRSPDYVERLQKGPRYMLRSHRGDIARARDVPRHYYTKQQLKEAFRKYQGFCEYQRRGDQFDRKIASAMRKFPNLKELTMSTQVWPHNQAFKNPFTPGYCDKFQEDVGDWPISLVPMRSLLLGAYCADLKIERLNCKQVNWRILAGKIKTFEDIKRSVRHLRELSITFSTGLEEEEDQWGFLQIEKCEVFLQQSGRLKEFVTSAPDLEKLEICFEVSEQLMPIYPTAFQHVVGDFYWPALKVVKFEMIGATQDHLVGFFERHASTIKDLCMGYIFLSSGLWLSVFERMRLVLKLDRVDVSGTLESTSEMLAFEPGSNQQNELREGLESYLLAHHADSKLSLNKYLEAYVHDSDDSDDSDDRWFDTFFSG